MNRTTHISHDAGRGDIAGRMSELRRTKGRTAPGRRTKVTDAVYFSYAARDRCIGNRSAASDVPSMDVGMYVRCERILMPEWCKMKDDQLLREYNGAIIYSCPEIAAENDRYSLSRKAGPNSGASPVRGCLRCGMSRLYNMKTAADMKYYFCGPDSARDIVTRMYGIRRHVKPAEPVK